MQNSVKTYVTKKTYVKPEVTVHGAVEDVTQIAHSMAYSRE